jgi:hypothetical protein
MLTACDTSVITTEEATNSDNGLPLDNNEALALPMDCEGSADSQVYVALSGTGYATPEEALEELLPESARSLGEPSIRIEQGTEDYPEVIWLYFTSSGKKVGMVKTERYSDNLWYIVRIDRCIEIEQ